MNDLPEDIRIGKDLLETAEKNMIVPDESLRSLEDEIANLKTYRDALEYLTDYIEHNPDRPETELAKNIVSAHLRRFVIRLPDMNITDETMWDIYFLTLSVVRNYLRDAIADDAEACEALELFCAEGNNPWGVKNLEDLIEAADSLFSTNH